MVVKVFSSTQMKNWLRYNVKIIKKVKQNSNTNKVGYRFRSPRTPFKNGYRSSDMPRFQQNSYFFKKSRIHFLWTPFKARNEIKCRCQKMKKGKFSLVF